MFLVPPIRSTPGGYLWHYRTWAGDIAPGAIPVPPEHQPHSHLLRVTRTHEVPGV